MAPYNNAVLLDLVEVAATQMAGVLAGVIDKCSTTPASGIGGRRNTSTLSMQPLSKCGIDGMRALCAPITS